MTFIQLNLKLGKYSLQVALSQLLRRQNITNFVISRNAAIDHYAQGTTKKCQIIKRTVPTADRMWENC